jgi:hypothetical protein
MGGKKDLGVEGVKVENFEAGPRRFGGWIRSVRKDTRRLCNENATG